MSDAPAPERLVDLETRIAFIERSLLELSDALAEARRDATIDRLRLERALAEMRELRALAPADSGEEKPPHY